MNETQASNTILKIKVLNWHFVSMKNLKHQWNF